MKTYNPKKRNVIYVYDKFISSILGIVLEYRAVYLDSNSSLGFVYLRKNKEYLLILWQPSRSPLFIHHLEALLNLRVQKLVCILRIHVLPILFAM